MEVRMVIMNWAPRRGIICDVMAFWVLASSLSKPWILPHCWPKSGVYQMAPTMNWAMVAREMARRFMWLLSGIGVGFV